MSEEKKEVKIEDENVEVEGSDDFVSKKAYGEVSSSMHKYKNQLKDTQAKLNQLEAERKTVENEALAEQGRWEDLYKQNQAELETMRNDRAGEQSQFIDYHKKNSVLNKVGGFKRDEYNKFIDVESINMNDDGSIDNTSLELEIDRIRQTYPELLKTASGTKLPNNAPAGSEIGQVDTATMTGAEKNEYFKSIIKNKQ